MNSELKRTPLYDCHQKLGARFVPFAGYEMPVLYSGVIEEHRAVRTHAGLFDVSHMGEIFVRGPEAEQALNYLTCNNVAKLYDGKAQYSAITNPDGGVIDDIIIYRFSAEEYLVCVNASNRERVFEWLCKQNTYEATFRDESDEYAQIAIQGRYALLIYGRVSGNKTPRAQPYFSFYEQTLFGENVICARTGYTGEDGLELFIPKNIATDVWEALLEEGRSKGLLPAGLGARDSLRLEACYPLHGHELGEDISAVESGLGWIVKLKKGDFIGREVLEKHKKESKQPRSQLRRLVGFFVIDKGIVREQTKLYTESGEFVGVTTSGTKTPTLNRALGLALVSSEQSEIGTQIYAEVRGKRLRCEIVSTPFFHHHKQKGGTMELPSDLKYTKEHEWVKVSDGIATVGITAFAQDELGEIVYVELPEKGMQVAAKDSFCVVESTKAASDVYAPVGGSVSEVNTLLTDSPDLVNSSPYDDGWMVKLSEVATADLTDLMDVDQYRSFIGGE